MYVQESNSTRESATLFVQSFTHLLWNIQKSVQVENGDHHSKN